MPRAPSQKLTQSQIDNLRSESFHHAKILLARCRESVTGTKEVITCKCGEEHEIFPNHPKEMSGAQVKNAWELIHKVFPGLKEEDLTKTQEIDPKALEERMTKMLEDSPILRETIRNILDKPSLKAV